MLLRFVIGRNNHVYRFCSSVEEIILWNLAIATPEVMDLSVIFWLVLDYWHGLRLLLFQHCVDWSIFGAFNNFVIIQIILLGN